MRKSGSRISVFSLVALLVMNVLGTMGAQPGYAQRGLEDLNYHVTQSGWRNLRYVRNEIMKENIEIWYVCGKRKILWVPLQVPFDHSLFELVNSRENKEFWTDEPSLVWDLNEFLSNPFDHSALRLNKAEFTAQLVKSCSAAPETIRVPAPINAGKSSGERPTFYYILPEGFSSVGGARTFWMSLHEARSAHYKIKPAPDYSEPSDGGDISLPTMSGWLIKTDPFSVMKSVINCDRNTVGTLRAVGYDENGLVRSSYQNRRTGEIIPNSVAKAWKEISCLVK